MSEEGFMLCTISGHELQGVKPNIAYRYWYGTEKYHWVEVSQHMHILIPIEDCEDLV